jgi:hypothetical protein
MASEARIMINGTSLTDQESMTVRLAMDALANILDAEATPKKGGVPERDAYMTAIRRVQKLLADGPSETARVN